LGIPFKGGGEMRFGMKTIRQLFLLIFLMEISYVGLTSVFLNTSLFQKVVALDPQEISIQFHRGWSIIPGWVDLKDVKILGQDRNVRWQVLLPDVKTRVLLKDLIQRQVHFKSLTTREVDFQLEMKSESEKAKEPISPIPTRAEVESWRQKRWQLLFDQIQIHSIKKLQVQELSFQGIGKITGQFYLWPGIDAEIGPAHLEVQSGSVRSTQQKEDQPSVMRQIALNCGIKIDRFHPYLVNGSEVFRFLNGSGVLTSQVNGVSVFNQYFQHVPQIRLNQGRGSLQAQVTIVKGAMVQPSAMKLVTPDLHLSAYDLRISGNGTLWGEVRSSHSREVSQMNLNLDQFQIDSHTYAQTLLKGKKFSLNIESNSLELASLFKNLWFDLSIPETRISHLHFMNSVFKENHSKLRVLSGVGAFSVSAYAQSGKVTWKTNQPHPGKLHFSLKQGKINFEPFQMAGEFESHFFLDPFNLDDSRQKMPYGEFSFSKVNWNSKVPQNWWMSGQLFSNELRLDHSKQWKGMLKLRAKDTLPVVDYFKTKETLSRLQLAVLKTEAVSAEINYQIQPQFWQLNPIRVKANSRRLNGALQQKDHSWDGALTLSLGLISVGTSIHKNQTELKWFPNESWLDREIQVLQGENLFLDRVR
jgi:hypothetical protein